MSSSHGTWTASPKDANSGGTFSASFLTGTTMLSSCTDTTPTQRSADAIPSTPTKWKEDASSAPRGIRDASSRAVLDPSRPHLLRDPWDHLVEYRANRRSSLKAEQGPRLRHIRDAPLHVVRKRFIRNVAEGDAGPESRPNGFGQLAYGHAD